MEPLLEQGVVILDGLRDPLGLATDSSVHTRSPNLSRYREQRAKGIWVAHRTWREPAPTREEETRGVAGLTK